MIPESIGTRGEGVRVSKPLDCRSVSVSQYINNIYTTLFGRNSFFTFGSSKGGPGNSGPKRGRMAMTYSTTDKPEAHAER